MHTVEPSPFAALHALEWLHAMGSDECVGNMPASWLDMQDVAPIVPQKIAPKIAKPVVEIRAEIAAPTLPTSQFTAKAVEIAQNCEDLPQLYEAISQFEGFARFQKIDVPMWQGIADAKLMIIAETPLLENNLFAKICKSAGINLAGAAYSIAILPFAPTSARGFSPQEFALGVPFLKRHIELQNPEYVLFLGNSALHVLPNASSGLLKLRGNWHDLTINDSNFKSFVTFHPNFLLKQPLQKKLVWQDMRMLRKSCDFHAPHPTSCG